MTGAILATASTATPFLCYNRRMKRLLILPVLLLLVGTPASSADFFKGLDAYDRGDYATALREFTPLAEQGFSSAQFNLGVMYEKGRGVPQNYKTAVKWYPLAAEQGIAEAQHNLGVMYDNGQGVPQNYKTAIKWYTLAAEQGIASAQYNLGSMYYNGRGVLQDYVRAHMWWNIAASSGHKKASENRDIVAEQMTPADISKAQDLAQECLRKNYKGC